MTGRHAHAARRQLGIPARRFQPGAEHRSSHVPSGLLPFGSEQLLVAAAYGFFAGSNLELLLMNIPSSEKITIIEGPTPTFEYPRETWALGLAEGPHMPQVALTRLRTFNGPALIERCWTAWDEKRSIHLEYRAEDGLTQESEIVAARYDTVDEGHVLMLYVRLN